MCIGVGLGALLGIAQAAVSFMGAAAQANAQNAYYEQNRQDALAAMRDRYASLQAKSVSENRSSGQQRFEKKLELVRKTATAAVASAEGGVTGLSVDALNRDFIAQQARRESALVLNEETRRQAIRDQLEATYHQTIARINSVRRAVPPNPIGFVLQGLGGALKASA